MKVVRNTLYRPTSLEPMSIVMREVDIKPPLEAAIEDMRAPVPGLFHIVDVFEVEDGLDEVETSARGAQRQVDRDREERDMALLFYWDQEALERVSPGGVLTASRPAPLTVEQISYALKMLAHSPAYRGQTVTSISKDLKLVHMHNGQITVQEMQ